MPPATADDLLAHLSRVRLIDADQRRRLRDGWPASLSAADAAAHLTDAGLLTPLQAEWALAGRARRLRMGPYVLLERLGSGGGGVAYKAEHDLLKRAVTLKVFARRARPRDELAAAGRLAHPNLAAALHAGRVRGRLVLVLEFVDGVDLHCLLSQTGPLPLDLVREVLRQTAQALLYLHARDVLHHDVKPANLLLAHESDGRPLIKLIDFGLARPAGGVALAGTIDYLAPERGEGAPADARGDLYSLGCTAYHLLTGQVPHVGGTWTEKLVRHRTEDAIPMRELRPGVPAHLAAVVARLMARDPAARYADAAALLADLDPPPLAIPIARPVARRRINLRPVALVAVALFVGAFAGGAARVMLPEAARVAPVSERNVIVVAGMDNDFADLQSAVNAAPDGGVVTLRGNVVVAPVSCGGKSLTLRAAEGTRAALTLKAGDSWDALVHGNRDVRLIGLDLVAGDRVAPLVSVTGGSLTLTDCTLRAQGIAPLVALRKGLALRLERCQLDAAGQGIAVEAGASADIALTDTTVLVRDPAGAALLLWSSEPEAGTLSVSVRRGEIDAGRIVALRGLGARVSVDASSCRFTFRHALASIDACRGDWRTHLRWQGSGATFAARGPYLRHDGKPLAWDESAWAELHAPEPR